MTGPPQDPVRSSTAHNSGFGLLVDTGAEEDLAGEVWLDRYVKDVLEPMGYLDRMNFADRERNFRGIGGSIQTSDTRASLPIAH